MGEKKIQKFVRRAKYFDKHFTVFVYSDPNAVVESILAGPKHIIIITRELTEIDSRIDRLFEPTCIKCYRKYSGNYFRVEIRPDGGVGNAVCGDCDPTVRFAVAYFEVIDPLFRTA